MRRTLVALAASSLMLFGLAGAAQAAEPEVPPAFAPPAPAPVTDEATAEAFLNGYASEQAERFLRTRRSRVRVLNVESACLQHPVTLTRFGCAVRLRALVIQRRHHWRDWSHGHSSRASKSSRRGDRRPRVRIRAFGCLGIARIDAVDAANPTVAIPLADCQRIRRADLEVPEPV